MTILNKECAVGFGVNDLGRMPCCKHCDHATDILSRGHCFTAFSWECGFDMTKVSPDCCAYFEPFAQCKSRWTKAQILDHLKEGGASEKVISHVQQIPLPDLQNLILEEYKTYCRGQRRLDGKYRRTQFWAIDWKIIDHWEHTLETQNH